MFPTAARFVVALALITLATGFTRADDPEYEGVKVSKWIDTVQKGESARQRALAVDSLGKICVVHNKDNEVLRACIANVARALNVDPSASVRAQAALTLAGMRSDDLKYFSTDLVAALGTEKEARVRKLILAAMSKFPATCVLALEVPTGRDTAPLLEALKDPDPAVKAAAAEAVALAGNEVKGAAKSAAPGLVPLLKDKEKSVRLAAVYAVARTEPEGASTIAEALAGMLAGKDEDAEMKRELVTSLGLLSEKSGAVVKALAGALAEKDEELRRRAARVLGTFGTAAAPVADELLKVITTEELKDIRVDAVRALGSALGPAGMKSRLKELLPLLTVEKQPAYEVRIALVDEIGALGWIHLGTDLTSGDKDAKAAATEVVAALRRRLADPQIKVREAAQAAIRKIEKKPEPKKELEKKESESSRRSIPRGNNSAPA